MGPHPGQNEGAETSLDSEPTVASFAGIEATGNIIKIVVGSLCGVLFLTGVVVVLVVYRHRCNRRKSSWNFEYYDLDSDAITKSAPISRSASPVIRKKKSCPDLTVDARDVMVRSATCGGCAPDFILPPERIQPYNDHENGPITFISPENCVGIRPDLYRSTSESDEEGSNLPRSEHGRIWFSVVYDCIVEQLNVKLIKVKELSGRKNGHPPDPYVRIFLLPDERNSKTSKVKKKTIAPIYNELFIFEVPVDEVGFRTLRFSVYEMDKRKVRHALGHALVPLADVDITKDLSMWRDLETNSQISNMLGEINIGLCYLPHNDKIKVVILGGRHLKHLDYDRISGIYVKVQMNLARRPHKSKKTTIKPVREDPTFNEAFSFCISGQPVDTCNFVVTVMVCPKKYLGQNEVYGKASFGSFMYARGNELVHWQEMMSQPRVTINKWHTLANDVGIAL